MGRFQGAPPPTIGMELIQTKLQQGSSETWFSPVRDGSLALKGGNPGGVERKSFEEPDGRRLCGCLKCCRRRLALLQS